MFCETKYKVFSIIFFMTGTIWAGWLQDKKIGSAVVAEDNFGYSVVIAGDWAAVGNPNDDDNSKPNSGSVYIFKHNGTSWGQYAKKVPSNPADGDQFGASVALNDPCQSSHGESWLLVGAPYGDVSVGDNAGKVYFFKETSPGSYGQYQTYASDYAADDAFGTSVWMDPKGEWAIVGSPNDDDKGTDSGSAYVYHYNGTTWVQTKKLIASNGQSGDHFGFAVAITDPNSTSDGNGWALVGSPDSTGAGAESGKVYFYKNGISSWPQWQTLASDGAAGDHYGSAVAISGEHAIVGSPDDDDNGEDSGSAYVYLYRSSDTRWLQYKQRAWPTEADPYDHFGSSVAISDDYAVVGVPYDDDNGSESGSAFVYALYEYKTPGWPWLRYFASDGEALDQYGSAVAIHVDRMLVGAPLDDNAQGTNAGASYFYQYEPGSLTVTQPNGGENVVSGTPYEITWDTGGRIDRVFLEYSDDNGIFWAEIDTANNFGSSAGLYVWDFPDINSASCLLRATDYFDPSVIDLSDDVFSVFLCDPGLVADLTGDCFVGIDDFAEMVSQWLQSGEL